MSYKRVLSIQDISCFGQCSTTVALPIISACGVECSILPSAVLSTHTAGFSGFTCRDLADDFPAIFAHWKKEGIHFDAIYTGYLGSKEQVDYILDFVKDEDCMLIVDPAMGDNGKLYPAFDMEYVKAMRRLCAAADIVIPNQTEYDFLQMDNYKTLVLTGASKTLGKTGVLVRDGEGEYWYEHELFSENRHGTGDIYSSAFVGALMNGKTVRDAAKIAADFTKECVRDAQGDKDHFYGVKFEKFIPMLIDALK